MKKSKSKELQTLNILQEIKANSLNAATLSPRQRKLLIPFLVAEGQSTAEIAHLLKVSDRTIERDKNSIRQSMALSKDPALGDLYAGRLVNEAQISIQRIRKFQRDPNCPPAAKIDGERACFQISNELTERLQSMGYLPTAAKKLEADLNYYPDDKLSLDEIATEAGRLQDIKDSLPKKKTKKVKSRVVKKRRLKDEK